MSVNIITKYKRLAIELPNIIELSGYKTDFIAKKIGVLPNYFRVKKQRNKFSFEEVEKIINVIYNDDVSDYILGLEMDESLQDETNVTMTYDELKKEMNWK